MSNYNINELLEKKKDLEKQIEDKIKQVKPNDLTYTKEIIIDHTNKDKETPYVPRERVKASEYCQEIFGMVDELVKIKTAIQDYNAKKVLGKIQEREAQRKKIQILDVIKVVLPSKNSHKREVSRYSSDDVALESKDVTSEPMFPLKDIEKMHNEFASQERKLNTHIQKENLNATIEL